MNLSARKDCDYEIAPDIDALVCRQCVLLISQLATESDHPVKIGWSCKLTRRLRLDDTVGDHAPTWWSRGLPTVFRYARFTIPLERWLCR